MFSQVITVFQGFFSRAFWFGSFLPVAIFAALHAIIAWIEFPETVLLPVWIRATDASVAALIPAVMACLVVLAYALTPLIPFLRGLLDGSLLPDWLHDGLRKGHVVMARDLRDRFDKALADFSRFSELNRAKTALFQAARNKGVALKKADKPDLVDTAAATVDKVWSKMKRGALPEEDRLDEAAKALIEALERNSAGLARDHADWKVSDKLNSAQARMDRVYKDAEAEANHRWSILSSRYGNTVSLDSPQATSMGDAKLLSESYSTTVYGVGFDFMWPRLQLVLPDQGAFIDRIIAARSQIDFAILSLALTATLPLVWFPVLVCTARSPFVFLAIGAIAPLLGAFFYRLVVESQVAFGELVKTAIDKYRIDLLKLLRLPVPATLSSERALWSRMETIESGAGMYDVTYRHPT